MKKYPKYKKVDSKFFDEIPENWYRLRVKNLVGTNTYYPVGDGDHGSIKPEMYEEEGIPYIRVQNLTWNGEIIYDGMVYINQEIQSVNKKSILYPGDILIAKTGATVGKLGLVPNEIIEANTTSSVGKLTVDRERFDPKYIMYCFQTRNFQEQIWLEASQKSAQPGFNIDDLIIFEIVSPNKAEQTLITRFLDSQTIVTDELIKKKERLIDLLIEKRRAIINEAITKGLNPKTRMKDSGIACLGTVPDHWKIARIGHYTQVIRGASPRPAGDPRFFGSKYMPWITVGEVTNVGGKYLTSTEKYLTEEGSQLSRIIYPGTLLLSNSGATLGVPIISKIKGCINDGSVAFISFDKELERDFLYYFFITHTDIYRQEMSGYGQPNLNTEIIKSTRFPLPPLVEQIQIIKFIEHEFIEFENIIDLCTNQISKLKEYRQSLISEVVTGKIDVRGWQPNKSCSA